MPDRKLSDANPRLYDLLALLAKGSSSIDQVLGEFPDLRAEDVWGAIAFAAEKALSDSGSKRRAVKGNPDGGRRETKSSPTPQPKTIQLGLFGGGDAPPPEPVPDERALDHAVAPQRPVPETEADRVLLFRELFRGREDVFAIQWQPPDGTKPKYVPRRHGGKTGPDLPLSDREVSAHLTGRQVIGVYPLLQDDTCWFLAVDFDKEAWKDDVAAFRQTCEGAGIPCAVEISRSGNGAHAWFFFLAPVGAGTARRFGSHLLTLTASRRGVLSLGSYDRLFPNQDTLPEKGYGNLIALPLQAARVNDGCSVFVDEQFVPYADQWAFLAGVARLNPLSVRAMAESAERQGLVYGYLPDIPVDQEALAPWERPPYGRRPETPIPGPIPPRIRAVLAQRLFIETKELPPALIDRLRRMAAFKNPVFFRNQQLRKSNHDTPMFICCAQEHPEHVGLPRGCVDDASQFLAKLGASLEVEDRRTKGKNSAWSFKGSLRPVQERAMEALSEHDFGVFVAPPGTGKTVVGVAMIAQRKCSTLVLVHQRTLLDQWRHQIAKGLGLDLADVGQIGGGKRKPNGRLDVASVKSLIHGDEVDDLVAEYGLVIVDECHHVPAFTVEKVMAEARAKFVLGLTATPYRQDGHHPILNWQCGPVRFRIKATDPEGRPPYRQRLIKRLTCVGPSAIPPGTPIPATYPVLAGDEARNRLLVEDIVECLGAGRFPVVLSRLREHLDVLAVMLREREPSVSIIILRGAMKAAEKKMAFAALDEESGDSRRVILATGSYLGEGFDAPRLDTLFLALPISWKGTLEQYAGRIHRPHPDKTDVRVYDYVDDQVPALRSMFTKRLRGYRGIGYALEDDPWASRN